MKLSTQVFLSLMYYLFETGAHTGALQELQCALKPNAVAIVAYLQSVAKSYILYV